MADHCRAWPWTVAGITLAAFALAVMLAPAGGSSPARGLVWLLFVGSSVHIASTAVLFSFTEVRRHAVGNPRRYVVAPTLLVVAGAVTAAVLPAHDLAIALLGYFGWQFFHYQKQNLGLVTLTGAAGRLGPLERPARRAITASGWQGSPR